MTPEDLDQIQYLPSIRSRQAELRGYGQLREATKTLLRPLISLGKLGKVDQPERLMETVRESIGQEGFVDLNTNPGQTCAGFERLCDPTGNYAAWRALFDGDPALIPVALLRDNVTERPFVRQVLQIERDHSVVAIRSKRPAQDLPMLQAALSAVDDVNNLLIVLDFGYIRPSLAAKEQEALRVISALRTIDETTRIVVMASSFPKAVSAFGDMRGSLEITERDLHARVGGDDVAIYGDHASIYPEPFEPQISRFVPRIDYCLEEAWLYERRRADDGGYVACARSIVASPDWEETFADIAWGAGMIRQTSQTGLVPAGFGSPSNWIAARVNMHIERQVDVAAQRPEDEFEDED
ncbi:beta family protein [Bradyrhizobium zhanjiangense]|uniref:T4 beta protein n=1 Tax=Bradyrhizobium zhanjiangense TaxID=1325107 RepID=A0ABY0DI89_9BRAD|nr:beta family protein [Bradyrhizobium zhanjiangense]RXG93018.1 hypothetical protein EAS62_20185 [Bradyrhizobium zhanjiangense]